MAAVDLTRRALAASLRRLLMTRRLSKITVRMITDDCGVSRHTFYHHFADVYDLLTYLFRMEIVEDLPVYCRHTTWRAGVDRVLTYTADNPELCLSVYHSLGRERSERFLCGVFNRLLRGVVDDLCRDDPVDEETRCQVASFFAFALLGQFLDWLSRGLEESPLVVGRRIEEMMDGTIRHVLDNRRRACASGRVGKVMQGPW
ncbi:hypothetical protein KEM60_01332 [Austwickia sp. TVS 96-490-7B]|uniref:TetR-like C-terminal domain-containing protein n=1 Tax=Austwickia sp. TVS 96-490-7B TaxID=2830843 RepID=UPI001C564DC4|nr:TetR-like C-terminal domain-containing protein [Austwickia sp. TVS 96-490-7B]MBW3085136.1 hypothetical protein [Austwickia sp. TVS 96-490-7B]